MYYFEHKNHDVLLSFLFQNLDKLFLRAHNLPYLSGCKNLIFQVIMFP